MALTGLVLLASCRKSGGGSAPLIPLSVTAAASIAGPPLPSNDVFLNDTLVISFSEPIDSGTVNTTSLCIRRADDPQEAPAGDLVVSEHQVFFVSALPSSPDLSDTGFAPDVEYTITVPAGNDMILSTLGASLDVGLSVSFTTRSQPPLLRDPVGGEIFLAAAGIDLDGNGEIEADSLPETTESEEFFDLDSPEILVDAPTGLARAPLTVAFLLNKPVDPVSVFEETQEDGSNRRFELIDTNRGAVIPTDIRLAQRFDPDLGHYRTALLIDPRITLPPLTRIEARVYSGIMDLGGRDLGALTLGFTTTGSPATFQDILAEDFSDRRNIDPFTTAFWDIGDSNFLQAGPGIGGTGMDGPLLVIPARPTTLDTSLNSGQYHFTDITIEPGAMLIATGTNPLTLMSTGDVNIQGTIIADGQDGSSGIRRGGDRMVPGGSPGPGAGAGGNANDPPNISFSDDPCQLGGPGKSPVTMGGGGGGKIGRFIPGGGGGGGHALMGTPPSGVSPASGGISYGDPTLSPLLGGSGGGGAGDGNRDDPPEDESTGGSGGGGGGAVLISCAGTVDISGAISVNGGNGGAGGLNRGQTPGGGGGGGGSGGSVKIQANRVAPLVQSSTQIHAQGGRRGSAGGGGAQSGGHGSTGRIRLEVVDKNGNNVVDQDELVFLPNLVDVDPLPSIDVVNPASVGRTFAQSKFIDTGVQNARFSFDGSNPNNGQANIGPEVEDFSVTGALPRGSSIRILFSGANEDPDNPGHPDIVTAGEFTTRIETLNGFRFIRYRIEFVVSGPFSGGLLPIVTRLAFRFDFDRQE